MSSEFGSKSNGTHSSLRFRSRCDSQHRSRSHISAFLSTDHEICWLHGDLAQRRQAARKDMSLRRDMGVRPPSGRDSTVSCSILRPLAAGSPGPMMVWPVVLSRPGRHVSTAQDGSETSHSARLGDWPGHNARLAVYSHRMPCRYGTDLQLPLVPSGEQQKFNKTQRPLQKQNIPHSTSHPPSACPTIRNSPWTTSI